MEEWRKGLKMLPKLIKEIREAYIPVDYKDYHLFFKHLYVRLFKNKGLKYFIKTAGFDLVNIQKVLNEVYAYHIWFTEIIPFMCKYLTDESAKELNEYYLIYNSENKAEFYAWDLFTIHRFMKENVDIPLNLKSRTCMISIHIHANRIVFVTDIEAPYK